MLEKSAKMEPGTPFFWQRRDTVVAELHLSQKHAGLSLRASLWHQAIVSQVFNQVRISNHHHHFSHHHSHHHRNSELKASQNISNQSKRAVETRIKIQLSTIHPNPGPRNKTEEGKEARRMRRKERREDKRKKKEEKKSQTIYIATWNVQKMSLGTRNKRKAKAVAEYSTKKGWDAVLLSEVRSERQGTVWLGEGENLTAITFTNKAAILLRGNILKAWCEGGQQIKSEERSIAVRAGELVLIATYQPVFKGNNELELETAKEEVKRLSKWAGKNEVLITGGDWNAHIGGGEERQRVCGKFGLRETNGQGMILLEWLEENDLTHVNSFFNHQRRGTWFHMHLRRWYELDGFVMRDNQRHKFAKKLTTVCESSLSDHKPKLLKLEINQKIKKKKREKRIPRIKWEVLKDPEKKTTYRQKINEILTERGDEPDANNDEIELEDSTNWNELAEIVNKAAVDVCGVVEKKIENPWLVDKDEQITIMRSRITTAINTRNDLMEREANPETNVEERADLNVQLNEARNEIKEARRELQRKTRQWEKEWYDSLIEECERASETGNSRKMYDLLKQLGARGKTTAPNTTILTKEDFREQFKKVSEHRFENAPEDIDKVLEEVEDIRNSQEARFWRENLEETPSKREIVEQMRKMKDSAPGEDGVRLMYLMDVGEEIINRLVKIVQFMFNNSAETWEDSLKTGLVIPLFKKKGNINVPGNYRGVVLLAMGSRILARVIAERLRLWAENMHLLDEEQAGFRKGRSTADVTQIMVRIQEDVVDLRRRLEAKGETIEDDQKPTARLLDLRKAYPRVNKYAMWQILEKYGMGQKCLRVVKDLHETTTYKVKSREGQSEPWTNNRGFREGCPSSPVLFNIFHQVVMRIATKKRKLNAEAMGEEMGLSYKWVPGSSFPNEKRWETSQNSEAKRIRIDKGLFADDTTKIGKKRELEEGLRITKEVMNSLEERNNDEKEEVIYFGEEEGEKIRVLGCYLGPKEDCTQRIRRAGMAWSQVKPRLKGSKMSKHIQARVAEACVESTLLFDCQTRTWHQTEIKKLQSAMDRKYRYIWSNKTKPPLMQMQEQSKNMQDVRNALGVKTVRWKIEKRALERLGHIMRMEDDRQVKAVTLGWLEDLENHDKMPGKKRKTVLYWKRLVKEAGLDCSKIGALTKDRKEWKRIVNKRMKHLKEWEQKGGKATLETRGVRNQTQEQDSLRCDWEGCDMIAKSKAGLTIHRKRMHEQSKQKVTFTCELCTEVFKQKANLLNHKKACTGLKASKEGYKKCDKCLAEFAKKSFNQHYKKCTAAEPSERPTVTAEQYVSERGECDLCGKSISLSNMSRHKRRMH